MSKIEGSVGGQGQNELSQEAKVVRIINTLAPKSSDARGDQLVYAQGLAASIADLGWDKLRVAMDLREERRLNKKDKK